MTSLYQAMVNLIEQKVTPLAGSVGQQRHVIAIRDGFVSALPFMIIGSFMLVFIFPPFSADSSWAFARGWLNFSLQYREQLMLPFYLSMGVMTFFISVGIGASLGRHYKLDPIMTGLLALMAFLLVAAPYRDGTISAQYFSGEGIFTAIITALYAGEVYAWLKRHKITIRLPQEVPTGVARSFEILIPVVVIVATLHPLNLLVQSYTGMIIPQAIMHLLQPLVSASDSLPAILISVLICQVLWFAGIHGALIVTGIMNPFWMTNLALNQSALAAGAALPHIYLQGFWDHYLLIGGVGSTLPLAFLLLRSRAAHLRSIGKMGVVPSIFNINEPILFGAPIIMNPVFFLPFILVPMINATFAYIATKLGWVAQVVSLTPWTTPAPIGASWAANWALSPLLMCLFCMVLSALMYYPFLKAYERTLIRQEQEKQSPQGGEAVVNS
ncbi:PTS sugar transporter subunit IIC [Serratia rubidaea]|uniref:PTS sugar transporter subunit IIC n=1 Tax=Serratia rubidaea TaxID=61652 RepID=UPI0017846C87|nr:PTS sugar transporter subunit IIC [Serratia rubidaea]MBD8452428.1 PTS sugar transporter subunit IIC [Serratia rubidaea]